MMKVKVKGKSLSRVQLFATTWTVAYQAPPSMGFSRQENWSELPFPSPGIFSAKFPQKTKDLKFQPLACCWEECNPCNKALWVFSLVSRALLSMQSCLFGCFFFFFLVAKSCLTFCDPKDCSPPGSSVHGVSRQDHWSGLPGDLPGKESNSCLLHWQEDSLLLGYLESVRCSVVSNSLWRHGL